MVAVTELMLLYTTEGNLCSANTDFVKITDSKRAQNLACELETDQIQIVSKPEKNRD